MGEPSNTNPDSFWLADQHEAATRLAAILQEEHADVLTIYDPNGGYGHPDHIQVYRVGTEAAELARIDRVYWATMNRNRIQQLMADSAALRDSIDDERADHAEAETFGMVEDDITHAIDVAPMLERKRQAMAAHASQISEEDFFLTLPEEDFAATFGTEWFVAPQWPRNGGEFGTSLFD